MFFWTPRQAAQALESIYDEIADEFDTTRQYPWGELSLLFKDTPTASKILDLGCGNGRLVQMFKQKNCEIHGVDISERLLYLAQKKHPKTIFYKADFLDLPFPDQSFDEVWCIAAFHHAPNASARKKTLQQIHRILKPGGKFVLTVWNLWDQKKYVIQKKKAFWRSCFLPWWKKRDFLIPWGKNKKMRYYHSFDIQHLQKLLCSTHFEILEYWGSHNGFKGNISGCKNICLRAQKSS